MKTILVDAINTFFVKWEWINQGIYKLLESYPNNKIILTNADEEKQESLGFINMPYKVFTLNFSPEKTNHEYYKTLLSKYELSPLDVIYFEHNIDAVNAAKSVWINTYHYDKDLKDLAWLEEFIKNNI